MAKLKYTYRDIDISLERKHNGDINDFTSIDAVRSSINNIIQTMKGSRRKLPEFASGLWEYLFEPMDEITAQSIGEYLVELTERWEPRVIIENVHVIPNYQNNRYEILTNFRVRNSGTETQQVQTILERG